MGDEDSADALLKKVKREVMATGYPLELRIGRNLRARDWQVRHSPYYIDRDEGKGREIDLWAVKVCEATGDSDDIILLFAHLLVECKKSEKPWVAFTTPAPDFFPPSSSVLHDQLSLFNWEKDRTSKRRLLRTWSHQDRAQRIGSAFTETHKNRDRGIRPYEAMAGAVKAALHARDEWRSDRREGDVGGVSESGQTAVFLPIVVLDGPLFEATLEGDELDVEPVEHVVAEFGYLSPQYQKRTYTGQGYFVDVVTADAFERLLRENIEPSITKLSRLLWDDWADNGDGEQTG